jgi:hypothetical protein
MGAEVGDDVVLVNPSEVVAIMKPGKSHQGLTMNLTAFPLIAARDR